MLKKILNYFTDKRDTKKSISKFDEIQNDILGTTDLSSILRKAKIIAYKLKNKEFKNWIENELNGYPNEQSIPEYRKLDTIAQGDFINLRWHYKSVDIPLHNIPEDVHHHFHTIPVTQGIKQLESYLETMSRGKDDTLKVTIHAEFLPILSRVIYSNMECMSAWRVITRGQINQVLETTRNSLLNFILELADSYPEIKSDNDLSQPIPNEEIRQVFNYYILGGKHNIISSTDSFTQGENMTVFDQRHQKVDTQYNAAGDINFNNVQDSSQFIAELQKLKAEFTRIAEEEAIDGEIVTDAEYQLTKAIQQAQKPEPDKKTITDHLKTAKQLVEGVVTTAGFVTALVKAAEVAQTIFN